ncbi:MAG TPA: LodA/GoxA family CTQ-dependent oxidase [Holophagaceae bacterium]|nr:LodA/GoxA family CTQ-dependent oxidase [Holophagaceae bacterium]HJW34718.1 LodA/GoxA family CTQ-dependent oxidase [Holophagaceae bacterium]
MTRDPRVLAEASPASATPEEGLSRRDLLKGVAVAALAGAASRPLRAAGGTRIFRIHPAIGIARVGNATPEAFFLGPEVPGQGPVEVGGQPVTQFKVAGQVRPQAVRFRLFEYADFGQGLVPFQEITLGTSGVQDIRWTAHLANRKASFHQFQGPAGEEYDAMDQREAQPSAPLRNPTVTDRRSLETDFGPRTVSARSFAGNQVPQVFDLAGVPAGYAASWPLDSKTQGPVISTLGQLRTDAQGRLLVIGGKGATGYQGAVPPDLPGYANNDGWFDDVADGPLTATVVLSDGTTVSTDPATGSAWVLGAPPDYAPGVTGAVTLYDLLLDMAVRKLPVPSGNGLYGPNGPLARVRALKADFRAGAPSEFTTTTPYFQDDIRPMLDRAYGYRWVTELVNAKHDSMNLALLSNAALQDPSLTGAKDRSGVFTTMRPPQGAGQTSSTANGSSTMPRMQGDDPYVGQEPDAVKKCTVTHLQFGLLQQWARPESGFNPGAAPLPPDGTLIRTMFQVHGLDRAALEQASGGAFFPGIEVSWQIRNPRLFSEPFRLNHLATSRYLDTTGAPEGGRISAGHFSRQMALPWHADFNDCRSEGGWAWWPSQRPTAVFADASSTSLTKRVDWARPSAGRRYANASGVTSHEDMVKYWSMYGFVVQKDGMFIEQERNPGIGT